MENIKDKESNFTFEKSFMIEEAYKNYELLMHQLFNYKNTYEGSPAGKKTLILFYCLVNHYITANQFSNQFYHEVNHHGLEVYLTQISKHGFLNKQQVMIDGKNIMLYEITKQGAEHCKELLSGLYNLNNLLSPTVLSSNSSASSCVPPSASALFSSLLGEPYDYFLTKIASLRPKTNVVHMMAVRDLNVYLLSNPYINKAYRYTLEVPIRSNGAIATRAERARILFKPREYSLRCDALLECPIDKNNYNFFIEQDTGTQRKEEIQMKLSRYISTVLSSSTNKQFNAVMFCINTPSTDFINKSSNKKKKGASAVRDYLNVLNYNVWLFTKANLNDVLNVKLFDFVSVYKEFCQSEIATLYNKNSLQYFQSVLKHNSKITIKEVYSLAQNEIEANFENSYNLKKAYLRARYLRRRNIIFDSLLEMKNVCDFFLNGLSIYTTHNNDHDGIVPYLLPELFHATRYLINLISQRLLGGEIISSAIFHSSCGNVSDDGFVLKNYYIFNEKVHLFTENISDDLGGRYRVKHYLNNPTWKHEPGIILCLVADDDIDTAKELYLNTVYSQYMFSNHAATQNTIISAGAFSLSVYFVTYRNITSSYELFTFDIDGNILIK